MNSAKIVEEFWKRVWKARNPAAIDDFVVDDFVITTGGVDVVSKAKFKEWASAFMAKINDLQFEVIETFQNEDGRRVASRWRITTKNNGLLVRRPANRFTWCSGILPRLGLTSVIPARVAAVREESRILPRQA
jgi:SnoaL-like protein